MRVCPKCGYVDLSGWRQNRWRTDIDFMHWVEFKQLYHNLARDLEEGHSVVTDDYYAYRISGKKHRVVERVLLSIYKIAGKSAWHIPSEHFNHTKNPFQKRLVDFEKFIPNASKSTTAFTKKVSQK